MPKVYFDEASQSYKGDSLYFLEDAGSAAIKIGRGNALSRLRSLQTGNPNTLRLLAEIPNIGWQEAFWHCAWGSFAIRGEWFASSRKLRAAIAAVRAGRDWTDHVPILVERDEPIDRNEWREHMLDAIDAFEEVALHGLPMTLREAALSAIFDPDFDGRCITTRHADALATSGPGHSMGGR